MSTGGYTFTLLNTSDNDGVVVSITDAFSKAGQAVYFAIVSGGKSYQWQPSGTGGTTIGTPTTNNPYISPKLYFNNFYQYYPTYNYYVSGGPFTNDMVRSQSCVFYVVNVPTTNYYGTIGFTFNSNILQITAPSINQLQVGGYQFIISITSKGNNDVGSLVIWDQVSDTRYYTNGNTWCGSTSTPGNDFNMITPYTVRYDSFTNFSDSFTIFSQNNRPVPGRTYYLYVQNISGTAVITTQTAFVIYPSIIISNFTFFAPSTYTEGDSTYAYFTFTNPSNLNCVGALSITDGSSTYYMATSLWSGTTNPAAGNYNIRYYNFNEPSEFIPVAGTVYTLKVLGYGTYNSITVTPITFTYPHIELSLSAVTMTSLSVTVTSISPPANPYIGQLVVDTGPGTARFLTGYNWWGGAGSAPVLNSTYVINYTSFTNFQTAAGQSYRVYVLGIASQSRNPPYILTRGTIPTFTFPTVSFSISAVTTSGFTLTITNINIGNATVGKLAINNPDTGGLWRTNNPPNWWGAGTNPVLNTSYSISYSIFNQFSSTPSPGTRYQVFVYSSVNDTTIITPYIPGLGYPSLVTSGASSYVNGLTIPAFDRSSITVTFGGQGSANNTTYNMFIKPYNNVAFYSNITGPTSITTNPQTVTFYYSNFSNAARGYLYSNISPNTEHTVYTSNITFPTTVGATATYGTGNGLAFSIPLVSQTTLGITFSNLAGVVGVDTFRLGIVVGANTYSNIVWPGYTRSPLSNIQYIVNFTDFKSGANSLSPNNLGVGAPFTIFASTINSNVRTTATFVYLGGTVSTVVSAITPSTFNVQFTNLNYVGTPGFILYLSSNGQTTPYWSNTNWTGYRFPPTDTATIYTLNYSDFSNTTGGQFSRELTQTGTYVLRTSTLTTASIPTVPYITPTFILQGGTFSTIVSNVTSTSLNVQFNTINYFGITNGFTLYLASNGQTTPFWSNTSWTGYTTAPTNSNAIYTAYFSNFSNTTGTTFLTGYTPGASYTLMTSNILGQGVVTPYTTPSFTLQGGTFSTIVSDITRTSLNIRFNTINYTSITGGFVLYLASNGQTTPFWSNTKWTGYTTAPADSNAVYTAYFSNFSNATLGTFLSAYTPGASYTLMTSNILGQNIVTPYTAPGFILQGGTVSTVVASVISSGLQIQFNSINYTGIPGRFALYLNSNGQTTPYWSNTAWSGYTTAPTDSNTIYTVNFSDFRGSAGGTFLTNYVIGGTYVLTTSSINSFVTTYSTPTFTLLGGIVSTTILNPTTTSIDIQFTSLDTLGTQSTFSLTVTDSGNVYKNTSWYGYCNKPILNTVTTVLFRDFTGTNGSLGNNIVNRRTYTVCACNDSVEFPLSNAPTFTALPQKLF